MKRSETVVVVVIALLVAAPGGVAAQSVAEGSRVRVETAGSKSVGTLTENGEQQMTLRLENGSEIRVPWVDVEGLDVSRGKKGNLGRGAAIGFGVGALAGVAVASTCEGDYIFSEGQCEGMAVVAFGVLGAIGGALAGAFVNTERWERVDSGPQFTLTLPKRGVGAQVQVGW